MAPGSGASTRRSPRLALRGASARIRSELLGRPRRLGRSRRCGLRSRRRPGFSTSMSTRITTVPSSRSSARPTSSSKPCSRESGRGRRARSISAITRASIRGSALRTSSRSSRSGRSDEPERARRPPSRLAIAIAHRARAAGVLLRAPDRRTGADRAFFRRGGPAELQRRIDSGELTPDRGPARLHPIGRRRPRRRATRRSSRSTSTSGRATSTSRERSPPSFGSATAAFPGFAPSASTCRGRGWCR